MKFDMSRFKNYGLWVSILALVPMLLHAFGVEIVDQEYEAIAAVVLSILVALGIINNPTTECKWYKDDKKIIEEDIKDKKIN